MRGKKARALRQADPESVFSRSEWASRPALYTHPIDRGPGRKDRRRMLRDYDAFLARAARYRDRAASKLRVPTPNIRITTSLKLAGSLYHESDASSAWALVAPPPEKGYDLSAWKPL